MTYRVNVEYVVLAASEKEAMDRVVKHQTDATYHMVQEWAANGVGELQVMIDDVTITEIPEGSHEEA